MKYTYIIKVKERYWGPFKTAQLASRWAINNLVESCDWIILSVREAK